MLKYHCFYISLIFCFTAGCTPSRLTVQTYTNKELINNDDRIRVIFPYIDVNDKKDLTSTKKILIQAKIQMEKHLQSLGYTVIDTGDHPSYNNTRPTLIAIVNPQDISIVTSKKVYSCSYDMIDPTGSTTDSNNLIQHCGDSEIMKIIYAYKYDFDIYRPNTLDNDIITNCFKNPLLDNFCSAPLAMQNIQVIFSSTAQYTSKHHFADQDLVNLLYNTEKLVHMMSDAIFATYPLNKNFTISFSKTKYGYTPVKIQQIQRQ